VFLLEAIPNRIMKFGLLLATAGIEVGRMVRELWLVVSPMLVIGKGITIERGPAMHWWQ